MKADTNERGRRAVDDRDGTPNERVRRALGFEDATPNDGGVPSLERIALRIAFWIGFAQGRVLRAVRGPR